MNDADSRILAAHTRRQVHGDPARLQSAPSLDKALEIDMSNQNDPNQAQQGQAQQGQAPRQQQAQQQQQDQQTAQQLHDQLQAHLGSADSGIPAGAGAGTAGDFARGLLDAFRHISPEQWAAFLAFARSTGLLKF